MQNNYIIPDNGKEPEEKPRDTRAGLWKTIQRHPRFLSAWDSDIVQIDVSHKIVHEPDIKSYNLAELRIGRLGAVSINGEAHYPLTDFPYFLSALKIALNNSLFSRTSIIDDFITGFINGTLRLFCWLIHSDIYNLADLTPTDIDRLKTNWLKGGWWKLLKYDDALKATIEILKRNPESYTCLVGINNSSTLTITTSVLYKITGLPIAANSIPVWFVRRVARMSKTKEMKTSRKGRSNEIGNANFARFMVDVNRLAGFSPALGAVPFIPFPDASKVAEAAFPSGQGRTRNIAIGDALKIFSEGLRWVEDYSPIIFDVANAARGAVELQIARGEPDKAKKVEAAMTVAYAKSVSTRKKSLPGIEKLTRERLVSCMQTLLTACFCLIATNHGRRRNEILGHNLPYGLYFGCVRNFTELYENWRIDIFVEKSFEEYMSYWCNDIVRKAVACLEEISQIFRPLNTVRKPYNADRTTARADKLFRTRKFTALGFAGPANEFNFTRHSSEFFSLAGVDTTYLNEKTQPFRRLFACLYKYRHDIFVRPGLQKHLGHARASTTEVYYTDGDGTAPEHSVKAVFATGYGKELKSIEKVMAEVTSEYLVDIITRLLNGELIGGNFAKLVLKLMSAFSRNIKFVDAGFREKAEAVAGILETQGYSLSENVHGLCCATPDSKTKGRSKCFKDDRIHPEDATPKLCSPCLHLLTTEGYRSNLRAERDELDKHANDFKLPPAERLRHKKEVVVLDDFINADEKVAMENQHALNAITTKWQKIFIKPRS